MQPKAQEFFCTFVVSMCACVSVCLSVCVSVFSRPDRLRDIADRFNLDQDAVLDNVLYARAYTSRTSIYANCILSLSLYHCALCASVKSFICWLGGVTVRTLDLRSIARSFVRLPVGSLSSG